MKMLRGKMPNNCRAGVAIGKVNLLLLASLLTTSACVFKLPQPKSDLRAVTDGKLTLGVVASRDEQSGSNAYRLLLCKKGALKASHFDDSSFCRAALRDTSGAEVVLLANERRRSFAAKYGGYAAVLAGAALAAVGVRQGVKWAKVSSKKIDEVSKSAEEVTKQIKLQEDITGRITTQEKLLEDVNNSITAALSDIAKAEQQAGNVSQEVTKLQKELEQGLLLRADAKKRNGIIKRFKKINPELGERLESTIYGPRGPLNPDLLDALTKQVDEIDSVFAKKLQALKKDPNVALGKDGVDFYRGSYDFVFAEQHKQTMELFAKNMEALMKKKPSVFVEDITNAVISRREGALMLEAATELQHLERYRFRLGSMDIGGGYPVGVYKKAIAERQKVQFDIDTELAKKLGIDPEADFPTKFAKIKEHYDALTEDDHLAILKPDASMDDYSKHAAAVEIEDLYLRGIDDFNLLRRHEGMLRFHGKAGTGGLKRELKRVEGDITSARERLLTLEATRSDYTKVYAPQTEKFWERLGSLEGLERVLRQDQITNLNVGITKLRIEMSARKVKLDEQQKVLAGLEGKHAHLKTDLQQKQSHLAAQQQSLKNSQEEIEKLRAGLAEAEKGELDAIRIKKAEMEENKKLWGRNALIAGGGAALGATAAVALSLNESIWGHGEEAIGKKYWQQIFAADKGFANPLPVNNLPEIVRQIAQVFGKEVNQSAFDLR